MWPVWLWTRPPSPSPMAARKSTGVTKLENTVPRQRRRKTRASRSTTRMIGGVATSVHQDAASQSQEHVLERGAPYESRHRLHACAVQRREGGIAVVGVNEDAIRQRFDAISQLAEERQRPLAVFGRGETQLRDLPGGVAGDEFARRPLGHDVPAVHDHQPVAQLLGLVHVMGGEYLRDALLFELVQPF